MTEQDMVSCSDRQASPTVRRVMRWSTWLILSGVIAWQGTIITDHREKIRASNDRLFRIFHGSLKAVVMCDEKGSIVEYNKSAEEMFGWTRSEALGKDVSTIIPDADKSRHLKEFKGAVERLRRTDEDWREVKTGLKGKGLAKDGHEFPIVFSTRGIRYGNTIEFLAFFQHEPDSIVPKMESGPLDIPKKQVP